MVAANFIAYVAQVALVVFVCAGLPRVLGLRAAGVHYAFWRLVLLVCLALPLVQPWRPHEMTFVPDGAGAAGVATAPVNFSGVPDAPPPPPPFDWGFPLQIVILAGIGMRLGWMAIGVARLEALRRRSGTPALGFDDLQEAIGIRAPILWSPHVRHPVTFGLLRPVVLLPIALKSVDHAAQRAVVAHELHHVKRRDWAWVIGEEIVRSIFWFHPAMWWLISRVQLARETVVDELSILVTNARRTYLDTLLAFADDTGLRSSAAFSARRHLFHRVMLLSKEGGMSSSRIAVVSGALVVALGAGTLGAVRAFPLHGPGAPIAGDPQVQRPPRDPLSPATYHRQAVEYWEKAEKDSSLTPDQRLDLIQKGIAAEDRALALNPDYVEAMIYKNILLRMQALMVSDADEQRRLIEEANALRARAIELRKAQGLPEGGWAGGPPPPPPPPPPSAPSFMSDEYKLALETYKPLRIGGELKPPMKIKDVKPLYPPIAQSARVQGVVIVEAIIDPAGHVAASRVLRSIPLLDEAALAAVGQWEFTPTLLNGQPSAVMMTVTVNFTLQ
ncbi:MAG TPA: M56 family metallopeptidase [Vicinamibacterales bacterium]|nr:M56 family metallopeptidase [Vicinamibacterales bacterium]